MSALFCGIAIIGTISYIRLHKHCYHYNFLKDRWVICLFIIIINCKKLLILKEKSAVIEELQTQKKVVLKNTENTYSRQKNLKFSACLKNHSRNLWYILPEFSCRNSRYDALIRTKSPTNCDAHLAKSIFRTLIHKLLTDIQMEEQQYVETSYNLICLLAVCDYKR